MENKHQLLAAFQKDAKVIEDEVQTQLDKVKDAALNIKTTMEAGGSEAGDQGAEDNADEAEGDEPQGADEPQGESMDLSKKSESTDANGGDEDEAAAAVGAKDQTA